VKRTRYEAPHCAVFYSLLLLPHGYVQIFSTASCSQTPHVKYWKDWVCVDRLGYGTSSITSNFFFQFWFHSSPCISRRRMRSSSILPSLFLIDINVIRQREKQLRSSFGLSLSIFSIYMNLAPPYHSEVSSKKHCAISMCFRFRFLLCTVRIRFCASPIILIISSIPQYYGRDIAFWKDWVTYGFVRLR
jgi:hypothetical protein